MAEWVERRKVFYTVQEKRKFRLHTANASAQKHGLGQNELAPDQVSMQTTQWL